MDFYFTINMNSPLLSLIFIICGILVLCAAYGLMKYTRDDVNNVIYARLQILGIVDIISVVVLVLIGQAALGIVYFILAPFATHAIANGHYYGEQGEH